MDEWTSRQGGRGAAAAILFAGYVASVTLSLAVGPTLRHGAALWTAGGFLAAGLVLLPGAWRWVLAGACVAAQLAITLGFGRGWLRATLFPVINLVEAGLAAWLAVSFCGARQRRLSSRALTMILLAAVTPAAVFGGAIGALASSALSHGSFVAAWADWAFGSGLGLAIVLPTALLISRAGQYHDFHRPWAEAAGLFALLIGVASASFLQGRLPLLFVIFPAITLVALRLGPSGAALGAALVAAIGLPATLLGKGAGWAPQLVVTDRVRLAEVFVAALLFSGVATACALADQTRLRRLLQTADRSARRARMRARRAEAAGGARVQDADHVIEQLTTV